MILALDFDGVLHPYGCTVDRYFCRLELLEAWLKRRPEVGVVISSSWRVLFTRAQLRQVFRQAGLDFVADCLEDRARWRTPRIGEPDRYREVAAWLAEHHAGEPYVVIDDHWSGTSLEGAPAYPARVILCEPDIGLGAQHLDSLLQALRTRPEAWEQW